MDHLNENALVEYLEGRLDEGSASQVEAHLDSCGSCRELVAAAAGSSAPKAVERPARRLPGSRLGPYEIVDLLGQGGMGEVYRARDTRIGREVAIKIVAGESPALLRRFEQEARAAGALNHPNVLAVYDVGREGETPYLVCELLEGETLRARLLKGALAPARAIDFAVQLCRGLAAAHDKHILHRDLKPENVFLTRDGRLKILDFGLAKQTTVVAADGTSTGVIVGTVGYMSPEQVRGEPLDARSDLFALGAVLLEMLTGRRAFAGASAVEIMNAILKDDPPPVVSSPGLDPVVRRCLAKARDERFQTARDLAFALESASSQTAPPTALAPRRGRRLLMAALAGLAAVALVLIGTLVAPAPVAPEPRFQQLTYRDQAIDYARFSPDGQTVYFAADFAGDDRGYQIHAVTRQSPEARRVAPPGALLLSVSSRGELAIMLDFNSLYLCGTIARVPAGGGAPRHVIKNGCDASWLPNGDELAVVRQVDGMETVELPVGHVVYRASSVAFLRVSPDGKRVAFLRNPAAAAQGGELMVVDAAGEARSLAHLEGDGNAFAWSAGGELIVPFAGTRPDTEIRAIALDGRQRKLLSLPGKFHVDDIDAEGTLMLRRDDCHALLAGVLPGGQRTLDLTWLSVSVLTDVSSEGDKVLFYELSDARGARAYYLEPGRGEPILLGLGFAASLSPDGSRALVLPTDSGGDEVLVVPTGAGQPERVKLAGLGEVLDPRWLPDGQGFIFSAIAGKEPRRMFVRDAAGGVRAFGPPGVQQWMLVARPLSPDGSRAMVMTLDGSAVLAPLDGGPARPVRGLEPSDRFAHFHADGRLLVFDGTKDPCIVSALDPDTGVREVVRTIADFGGQSLRSVFLSADMQAVYYTVSDSRGLLYLASGLL